MTHNQESDFESRIEAENTLRLLAQLPPPDGLNHGVHARVRHQMALQSTASARRGFWSLWSGAQRLQFAAVAALVLAVAGSTWTINRSHSGESITRQTIAPVQPTTQDSGFGAAKVERVPATLNPIKVPPAPKKKPSPKGAPKPSPKILAAKPVGTALPNP